MLFLELSRYAARTVPGSDVLVYFGIKYYSSNSDCNRTLIYKLFIECDLAMRSNVIQADIELALSV